MLRLISYQMLKSLFKAWAESSRMFNPIVCCQEWRWSGTSRDSGPGYGRPHAWLWRGVTVSHVHTTLLLRQLFSWYHSKIFFQDLCKIFSCFRISSMIGSLKCPYPGFTTEAASEILSQIQTSIRQKVGVSVCRLCLMSHDVNVLCLQFICCSQPLVKVFWKCSNCCLVQQTIFWKVNLVLLLWCMSN